MDSPLITFESVTYSYPVSVDAARHSSRGHRPALENLSVDFGRGEYIALLGHNGSGKSTLARLANGLLLPVSGRVLADGLDTRQAPARTRIRELIGMIFSDPDNQIIATVVEDDVAWGPAARGWSLATIHERVDRALSMVGLLDLRHEPPSLLSGGQRQRLAIAGILALEPECIVADEPTALLDPGSRRDIIDVLHHLCRIRGLTIIHTTHLLEEAALADRIIVLDHGHIALCGAPGDIFSDLDRLRRLHLNVPDIALLAEQLAQLGLPVPTTALSPDAVIAALEARSLGMKGTR